MDNQIEKANSIRPIGKSGPSFLDDTLADQKIHSFPSKKTQHEFQINSATSINPYDLISPLPHVTLTIQEMQADPIIIMNQLQKKYEQYGAVRISACDQWKPPFSFGYCDKAITTRLQPIHKLMRGKAFRQNQKAYNIGSYTQYAIEFQKKYRPKFTKSKLTEPSQMEYQYWHTVKGVHQPGCDPKKYRTVVQYAADLPASTYGSGFPLSTRRNSKDENFDYVSNYFNLNNLYKSPSSILKIATEKKEFISGITTPWVYMGMQFASFCWHVEDMWLNSINYSHKGAIKTWYVIPRSDKEKFDRYVRAKTDDDSLLDRITFMIDPLELIAHGIKVFKTYQQPKDYICTFFKAYHCGFSQGYNVGEAVNFACPQSLLIIKEALKYYEAKERRKPSVLCIEWLLVNNMKEKHKNSIISEEYINVVEREHKFMQQILNLYRIDNIQIINENSKYDKNSCHQCKEYLYLSLMRCQRCNKNYCMKHIYNCCDSPFTFMTRNPDIYRLPTYKNVQKRIMTK